MSGAIDPDGPLGATGAMTGPMGPVGHYGYTGSNYAGPTGTPGAGATGATGPGTATVPVPVTPWTPHVNDGLHPEAYVAHFTSFATLPIKVTNVTLHAPPPVPLEGVIALIAFWSLLRMGAKTVHHVIDLLLRIRLA